MGGISGEFFALDESLTKENGSLESINELYFTNKIKGLVLCELF